MKPSDLTRRSFVMLVAGVVPAYGFTWLSGLGRRIASSATVYICPPCGLDCDKLEFDKPGACPVCGMKLIEKGSAVSPAPFTPPGTVRFPDGKTSVDFPFELLANSVFFQAQVNGKGPLLFGMDTGSFNSIVASEI